MRGSGVECRVLPGGLCLALVHRGAYNSISRAYEKVFETFQTTGRNFALPTREIYWKGPGMFFRGNPDRYVTEIQVFYSD